jgi:hypothetical protein
LSRKLLDSNEISSGTKERYFRVPLMIGENNELYYFSTEWTFDTGSRLDLSTLSKIVDKLYPEFKIVSQKGQFILCSSNTYSFTGIHPTRSSLIKPFSRKLNDVRLIYEQSLFRKLYRH